MLRTNSTTCRASDRGSGAVNSKRMTASAPATTPNNIHCKAMFESSSSEQTLMCFLPSPPNLNSVICNTVTSGSHIYKIAEKKPNPPKHRDQLQKSIQSKICKGHKINHTRRCFSLVNNILRHKFRHNPRTLRNSFLMKLHHKLDVSNTKQNANSLSSV